MTFNCAIKETAGTANYIIDILSRMHKYSAMSTTEYEIIPHTVDSTTTRCLLEITCKHIKVSDNSIPYSHTADHPYYNVALCGEMNFTHVNSYFTHSDSHFNKCTSRGKTAGYYCRGIYCYEEDMQPTRQEGYKLIKM